MIFAAISSLDQRKTADALVLPFWKGNKKAEPAANFGKHKFPLDVALNSQDFKGNEGEVLVLYHDHAPEKRLILLGLGDQEKVTTEKLRRAYAALTKTVSKKLQDLNLLVPEIPPLSKDGIVRGVSEGILLQNYAFIKLKSKEDETANNSVILNKVSMIGASKTDFELIKKTIKICEGVHFARDLVNGNADDITPQYLAQVARDLAKQFPKVKATVFDKQRIEKEKMGLILAVSRGSAREPALIILEYKGAPKSNDLTVVVGKGVTYDTGGLNLKPTGSMETMKCDMGGAATALGTIYAAASLGLKVNVTAVIPTTENSIGPQSYKPGDVYTSYSGKTVEIGNTDAEGRLILADALAYACSKLKPTRLIDFATLTGAIDIALGAETTGLMSNNDALADSLIRAGYCTYERVWRLPIYEEYRDQLKSEIADIKNIGGRPAGSITAAIFLHEFVKKTPWAHLDIASTAYLSEARRYHPKFGTGIGVRLMIEFLENL